MVWTPLKNISQLGWLFPIYGKIKNVPNHQPGPNKRLQINRQSDEKIIRQPEVGSFRDSCPYQPPRKKKLNALRQSNVAVDNSSFVDDVRIRSIIKAPFVAGFLASHGWWPYPKNHTASSFNPTKWQSTPWRFQAPPRKQGLLLALGPGKQCIIAMEKHRA